VKSTQQKAPVMCVTQSRQPKAEGREGGGGKEVGDMVFGNELSAGNTGRETKERWRISSKRGKH